MNEKTDYGFGNKVTTQLAKVSPYEERPQGDLISRSALKMALHNFFDGKFIDEPTYILRDVFCYIDNTPSVEQDWKFYYDHGYAQAKRDLEKQQGEWIRKVDEAGFISHICSECGAEIEVEDCSDDKFCFNCGADMNGKKGEAENEEDTSLLE